MNRESYDAIAVQWNAARLKALPTEEKFLSAFLDRLPTGSDVLDLGCGTGCPIATHLVAHGHRITGVDQSSAMLEFARARLPGECWVEADIKTWIPNRAYAGVVCWDALFHIERRLHEPLIARWAESLSVGGALLLSSGGSEHPPFTDIMFGHEFFYDSHPPEQLVEILQRHRFHIVLSEWIDPPTPGRDKGRFAVAASIDS